MHKELKRIPSVDRLLREGSVEPLCEQYGRESTLRAAQDLLSDIRQEIAQGSACPSTLEMVARLHDVISRRFEPSIRPVINATGVVIHTNLGRAPLSTAAILAMGEMSQYSNLEYDLAAGERGSRYVHAEDLLCQLTGAEGALVVNNDAGAVLLVLTALARGREVVISRGQLVEIGGGFRIPEVMVQSGARLVEVGTTNRTYLQDYERAVGAETAMLLHVHTSNYRLIGFTHSTPLGDLVRLGLANGIVVVDDLGSGALLDTAPFGLSHEPTVQESLAAGADLTCISGDKLLGGPQAGIILGKADLITLLKQHPLTRALRVSKVVLAGLQATLLHYLKGEALSQVPVWQMISMPIEHLQTRATSLAEWLQQHGLDADVVDSSSAVGGGSLPEETLPTKAVRLQVESADAVARSLRNHRPAVVARIEDGGVLLDLRTVLADQEAWLRQALLNVLHA